MTELTQWPLEQLREGFSFLRRERLLLLLVLMIMVTNLIDIAKTSVLLPVWAQRGDHGVQAMSLLLTCMAGFSMLSSLLASWIGHKLPRKAIYFLCFLIAGPTPYVVLGLDWSDGSAAWPKPRRGPACPWVVWSPVGWWRSSA